MFDVNRRFLIPPGAQAKRASRKAERRRRRVPLEVELLEGRSVPAILMVTNSSDNIATNGSLRHEMSISAAGDTIEFAAGLAPIVLSSGTELPQITHSLSFLNLNASKVTIDGHATSRIFDISGFDRGNLTVTLSNLKLTNGNVTDGDNGGAVYSGYDMLTVRNGVITGNHADTGIGGGIYQRNGSLTIQSTTISNNSAGGEGGGIAIDSGAAVTIQNSTISGNTVRGQREGDPLKGGGIWSYGSDLTVQNSTISGNTVAGQGGGIFFAYDGSSKKLTVQSSTIAGNTAATRGGGIFAYLSSEADLANTIVAGNRANSLPNDLDGFDATFNARFCLIQTPNGAVNGVNDHNIFNKDPKLDPGGLKNNGGPTQTIALLPGSPAIDHGNSTLSPFPFDQRGPPFSRVVNGQIDIGAFEAQAPVSLVRVGAARNG